MIEKAKDIAGILYVMEKAFREFPGSGFLKYRAKKPETSYCGRTNDYIWTDIPISYVTQITGLEKEELETIHRSDRNGNLFFSKQYGREVVSITVSKDYDYD